MTNDERSEIKEATYNGNCDVVRLDANFQWSEFGSDELIIGKKYEILSSCCMQSVYIKKDDKFIRDDSGERYLYWKITNESGHEIYVWEGFFEENTNL
jgi:hypothetical protein